MKLISLPLSPFAARVRAAIHAKDLPVEIVAPPADWRTSAEYRKLNPLVRIPVLVLDDGSTLFESGVIVEYLEDAFPASRPLRPRSAFDRARVRLVTQLGEQYVLPAITPLFGLLDVKARDQTAIAAQMAKLEKALKHLNDVLRPSAYAVGDSLTTADVWLAPLRYTLEGLMSFSGRTDLLDPYAALRGYSEFARQDPHLGVVLREMDEGLKAFMESRALAKCA
jgi:glutathione S-transferase